MKAKQSMDKRTTASKTAAPVKVAVKAAPARSSATQRVAATPRSAATASGNPRSKTASSGGASIGARRAVDPDVRLQHIRTAAYFLAERRGFGEDHALDDWLAAEAEYDERLH